MGENENVCLVYGVQSSPKTGEQLPVALEGRLDFVGEGVIGEIKTAARKTGAGTWSLQLSAYAYAYRYRTGRQPKIQVIELVKTKEPAIEVSDFAVTGRDEAWFLEVASEVLHGIEVGAFFPCPSWQCPRCEYRKTCRGG